jgi:hypothetical protein
VAQEGVCLDTLVVLLYDFGDGGFGGLKVPCCIEGCCAGEEGFDLWRGGFLVFCSAAPALNAYVSMC